MILRRPFYFWGVLFFAICTIQLSYSQTDSIVVCGKIIGSDGVGMEDVIVSTSNNINKTVVSDKNGSFKIRLATKKEIKLLFSNIGCETEQRIIIPLGQRDFYLTVQMKAREIKTVVITDHKQNPFFITIDPKVVGYIPSATGDFNTVLFSLPGVSSHDELSSGYSVRGGNFDENLVYINDLEVYRPFLVRSGQQEGLSVVNPDMVGNIQFSAGGFDAKYGDKLSSVLDIQYKKPKEFNATLSGSLLGGSFSVADVSKDDRFTWMVGARYKSAAYLLDAGSVQGDYKPNFFDLQTFLTYTINEKWELQLLGIFSNNHYAVIPQSSVSDFGTVNQALQLSVYFNGQEIDQFQTGQTALKAIFRPNDKLQLQFSGSAYQTQETTAFDLMGQYYINQLGTNLGQSSFGKAVNNLGVGTFLNHGRDYLNAGVLNLAHIGNFKTNHGYLQWGLKFQHELLQAQLSQWNYIDSAEYVLPHLSQNRIELLNPIKTTNELASNRGETFLQYNEKILLRDTSVLLWTIGTRLTYWDFNQELLLSPRGNLSWRRSTYSPYLLHFATGVYYQPPFFKEFIDPNGNFNNDVKSQESVHFVLGEDYLFKLWGRSFKFTAEAYYKLLYAVNPYYVDDIRIQYLANNLANGSAKGIDLKINGEFVKGLESWFRLSVMNATYDLKDSSGVMHRNIPFPTSQWINFSLFFQDYLPRNPDFKVHLNLLFGSPLPFGPPGSLVYKDTLKTPAYKRVDFGMSYQLFKTKDQMKRKSVLHWVQSGWIGLDVLNLFQVNNVASYLWITDVTGKTYAIPNYLTSRQLNLKITLKF